MTAYQAFQSLYEHVKLELADLTDLVVLLEHHEKPADKDFLIFENGGTVVSDVWIDTAICQARLIARATAQRPASMVGPALMSSIIQRLRDEGTLNKFHYKEDGTTEKTGIFNYSLGDISPPLGRDPEVWQQVITFELYTNGS